MGEVVILPTVRIEREGQEGNGAKEALAGYFDEFHNTPERSDLTRAEHLLLWLAAEGFLITRWPNFDSLPEIG